MPNFDSVALFYDQLVKLVFGSKLYDAQVALFKDLPKESSVLVIGGGTGVFLHQFIKETLPKSIDYVEVSARMLEIAQKKRLDSNYVNIRFIHGDEQHQTLLGEYDIVILPFVLDLYPESSLETLFKRIVPKVNARGVLLVTDFCISEKSIIYQRFLLKLMYLFFGLMSGVKAKHLPDYKSILHKHGFQMQISYAIMNGFVESGIYANVDNGQSPCQPFT
jgi:tRNA (cmo5U34)-methyltransferase